MSRLRATLSSAPIDRVVQAHVATAQKALRQALLVCLRQGKEGGYAPAHVARVRRDLMAALGAVESVRRVVPSYDTMDPDFQPMQPYVRPEPAEVPVEEDEDVVEEDAADKTVIVEGSDGTTEA